MSLCKNLSLNPSKPLNTERTKIIETVENIIPITVINDIKLITLLLFNEKSIF